MDADLGSLCLPIQIPIPHDFRLDDPAPLQHAQHDGLVGGVRGLARDSGR